LAQENPEREKGGKSGNNPGAARSVRERLKTEKKD